MSEFSDNLPLKPILTQQVTRNVRQNSSRAFKSVYQVVFKRMCLFLAI